MVTASIYDEFIEFLAGGFSPQQIVNYKPSIALQQKAFGLIQKEKAGSLTADEQVELTYFFCNRIICSN